MSRLTGAREALKQLLHGLDFLQTVSENEVILHHDLKPENMVFTYVPNRQPYAMKVKIIDTTP